MAGLIEKVAVIGAGTMGNGIAQTFAAHEADVTLVDVDSKALEKGLATIQGSLARFVKKEKITQAQADEIVARIEKATHLDACKDCDLVVEAVAEDRDIKRKVFSELDMIVSG